MIKKIIKKFSKKLCVEEKQALKLYVEWQTFRQDFTLKKNISEFKIKDFDKLKLKCLEFKLYLQINKSKIKSKKINYEVINKILKQDIAFCDNEIYLINTIKSKK